MDIDSLWKFMKISAQTVTSVRSSALCFVLPDIYNYLCFYSRTHFVLDTDRWQLVVPKPLLYDLLGVSDDITVHQYTNYYFRDIELIVGPSTDEKQIVASTYGSFDVDADYQLILHNPSHVLLIRIDV